jgi:hypothetical protein
MASIPITLRVPEDDLREINEYARAYGISRTKLLIDSTLRRLPEHRDALEQRVHELERTVERLDRLLAVSA